MYILGILTCVTIPVVSWLPATLEPALVLHVVGFTEVIN